MSILLLEEAKDMSPKEKKEVSEQIERLKAELISVQEEMAAAMNSFEAVTEPELIEYYTYMYKAKSTRHGYLLKQLKEAYYKMK